MQAAHITPEALRTAAAARSIYQLPLGPMLCTLLTDRSGNKLATFSQDGSTGWFIRGGIDVQVLWPDQISETLDMGRNRTTATAGGITMHSMEWSGAPARVLVIETPEDGAFMLFPPGCFEGHADTHDAALA